MKVVTLPVVTEEEFPHGLRCMNCDRVIEPGQPYSNTPEALVGDSLVEGLYCVYC